MPKGLGVRIIITAEFLFKFWFRTGPLLDSDECALPHVEALFSWLDYCEQIINVSQKSLGKAVCENICEVFLSASLLPKLVKT